MKIEFNDGEIKDKEFLKKFFTEDFINALENEAIKINEYKIKDSNIMRTCVRIEIGGSWGEVCFPW